MDVLISLGWSISERHDDRTDCLAGWCLKLGPATEGCGGLWVTCGDERAFIKFAEHEVGLL